MLQKRNNHCCRWFGLEDAKSYGGGAAMKRDEEALVILTIFTDQYPFMLTLLVSLGDVASVSPLFSSISCSYPF